MHYKVANILTPNQISELVLLYNSMPSNPAHQDYNLFDVDKRHPRSEDREGISAFDRLDGFAGDEFKNYSHYFLEYGEESFTRMHTDAHTYVHQTMITVLDDKDLVGGESLVHLPYEKKARPSNKYAKREEGKEGPYGEKIIPKVVNLNRGQTLIYDRDLLHGVAQVESGRRLVLVSWYDKAD